MFKFEIINKSKKTRARIGKIHTSHGIIDTPNFIPVGTQGTVKALTPQNLKEIGAQIVLSNTYHLYLRPGHELIREAGGLHKFMNWDRPILTDSGGFQVFSLSKIREISDEGVTFYSHIDGSKHFLNPEKIVEIQHAFGSDIMMPLDECVAYPAEHGEAKKALERTTLWARRSLSVQKKENSTLFGIVQGSVFKDLRIQSAKEIVDLNFPGYGIGGLSVNEPQDLMYEMLDVQIPLLPEETPKHLLGVGYPENLRKCVDFGVDLFDCVAPTRLARHGGFFTKNGKEIIRNAKFEKDFSPLDETCDCYSCKNFSKSYLRHLFIAKEILSIILMSIHNVRFLIKMMEEMRNEIYC